MSRRSSAFLSALIVLGLVVPGMLGNTPSVTGTRMDEAVASAARLAVPASRPERDRDRADRDQGDEEQTARRGDRPDSADHDGSGQHRVGSAEDFCGDLHSMALPVSDACTHGPDPAPEGFAINVPVPRLSAQAAAREMAALDCDGDGQSGYRVQVLYVRASDVTSRHTQYLASIRGWAGAADQIFQGSAAATGGSRGLRFVHDANCLLTVPEVVLSPAGDGSFGTTITELRNQGYNRADRIYLVFTDASLYCGIGTLWSDDRASSANRNNSGPSYSRVDRGCWSGTVAAHELMHNLGGVQDSAPNSSQGGHCIDEYDVMCYSDAGSGLPRMRIDCLAQILNSTRFDCGHNDYFHTNPGSDNYLFSHWNPANNRFLTDAAPLAPPPAPPVLDDTSTTSGEDKKDKKNKKNKGKKGKGKHKKKRR